MPSHLPPPKGASRWLGPTVRSVKSPTAPPPTPPRAAAAPRRTSSNFAATRAPTREVESQVHSLGKGRICDTEPRPRHAQQPHPVEIVLDATEGFIPLWAKDVTLRWRFRESSMHNFDDPAGAKAAIRQLLGEALLEWGVAAPVKFAEDADVYDFELVMKPADACNASGCVLASSFFPDAGRHQFFLYPKMFTQSRKEQIDTFIHECGHVFGLRHFFAQISEQQWPSEIFGKHSKFSIMNYGQLSSLTAADKSDLHRLYQAARAGTLTHVNGTPIKFVKPFHTLGSGPDNLLAVGPVPTGALPQPKAALMEDL